MGYTIYFRKSKDIPSDTWSKIIIDARKVLDQSKHLVQYDFDLADSPQADATCIIFNGIGNDGHESFYFKKHLETTDGSEDFAFCKTAKKPYDTVVTAILWVIVKHTNLVKVTADGGFQDFLPGLRLAESCGIDFPQKIIHRMLRTLDPECLTEGYKLESTEVRMPANPWYIRKPIWPI